MTHSKATVRLLGLSLWLLPVLASDCQDASPSWALPVRVMTKAMAPVDGLRASDFRLTDRGVPRPICRVARVKVPLSLGILLDVSGSMGPSGGEARGVRAVERLLSYSSPQDEYFLAYARESASPGFAFTNQPREILSELPVKAKGKTALLDALHAALEGMQRARHWNRALLVISDGLDNASTQGLREVERTLSAHPVPIFLLLTTAETIPVREEREVLARYYLIKLVQLSGGYVANAMDDKRTSEAVTHLYEAVRSPYVLRFVGPEPGDVRVELPGFSPRPRLYYRGAFKELSGSAGASDRSIRRTLQSCLISVHRRPSAAGILARKGRGSLHLDTLVKDGHALDPRSRLPSCVRACRHSLPLRCVSA